MENKVNYTVVGVFVLVLFTALVGVILWLSGATQYRKVYDTYVAYMNESVSGLNLNASVKYRGVEVGRVKKISLYYSEQVRLELDIERGTPIKVNTVAVLRVHGLTGIAYVELEGGTREAAELAAKAGEKYPVIKTRPSLLARLDTAVTDLLVSLNSLTRNLNAVLDEENRKSFRKMVGDLTILTDTFAARRGEIDSSLQSLAHTAANAARASEDLPKLMERLNKSAAALEKMAGDASRASTAVGKTMEGVGGGVSRVNDEVLPELERTLGELSGLTASLRRVSEELERHPNQILVGKEPAKPGPGEH